LAAAIAGGGQLSVLLQATLEREARRTVATAQLQALGRPAIAASVLRADLGALVDDWRETLRQGVSKGREALARLLAGPVTFTPKENHRIAFGVTATPEALLGGVCKLNLVRVGTPPHFATLRSVRIVDIPKRKRAA
jgi:hypothetical protein